ncbi:WW domain-binding protein 1 [Polypterus senegalus]|uniref:WW domain-binding protein 1 n=1 Tax=Polypterus senegalus TaxID=55291 RepID=UPI0019648A1A|nr:WW domain-binding protein 1 [Polypterus senegalus]
MSRAGVGSLFYLLYSGTCLTQAKEFCFGVNNEPYRCEMGYCCGETECCTYYYELWWFWLVWSVIIMLSCCCAYRHRRVKMRLQQEQRQREISLMAYQSASSTFISPPPINFRFWTNCKLPAYEEIAGHPPTPPPPYSETDGSPGPHADILLSPPSSVLLMVNSPAQTQEEEPTSCSQDITAPGNEEPNLNSPNSHSASLGEEVNDLEGALDRHVQEESAPESPGSEPLGVEGLEDPSTRRRHVTGDSGIEVCICHMDDNSGSEDDDGECCQARIPKTAEQGASKQTESVAKATERSHLV